MNNREKGTLYEEAAAKYLTKQGLQIICRNFRCKQGEIDIVAKDDNGYVFVEVKYRKNMEFGSPQEAVGVPKQKTIRKVAEYFLYKNYLTGVPIRFDVVAITGEEINWIKNAF